MIEKEISSINVDIEPSKNQIFLQENSAQLCEGLGLPIDTPFEEITRQLRKDLDLSPFASSDEIVDAILEDLHKSE
jgi:hypothetical protein